MSKHILLISFLALSILFAGCDKKPADAGAAGGDQAAVEGAQQVEIHGDDTMKFDKKEIKVKAGSKVQLTLKHVGKMAVAAMGHNWVLLKPGVDMNDFAKDAATAKDTGYIPAARTGDVIVHTKTLGGGESDSIVFDAPAPGTYTFICSFPGHVGLMNGKFIVE